MTYAWREQYLDVNLTTGNLTAKPISRELLIQAIGGIGLAAQLVYENVHPDAEPLSEHNVLVFAAGPLSGTTWAGTGRLVVAGRSPLTGIWGEASIGGYFATQLKRCGYDAILVRGMSPDPVVLLLQDGLAELHPAADLWGLDTYQTEDRLRLLYPDSEVISIGPAGEHLVPMASLVHHKGNDIAARCGLGAIAGSKRLKAVVARGNHAVPIANSQLFNQLKKESIQLFNKHDFIQVIRQGGGTASAVPIAIEMADMTARNWDIAARDWKEGDAQQLSGPAIHAQFPPRKDTCYACPVGCKWTIEVNGVGAEVEHLAGPEYESITGLGSQVQVSDPMEVMRAGDLCNRLGMDSISAGATIAWALEVHQHGLLPNSYLDDDLPLSWGNAAMVRELLLRMAENRPRLGALLAQGSRRASHAIGAGEEIAIQVKGLELPFHHPRALRGLEIAYATLPRGASHNEEGVAWDWQDSTYESWVEESIHHMNLSGANSSMVYCQFLSGALNADYTARLLTAVTGVEYTPADLIRSGERTWYLRRLFNMRLGVGAEEDTLPKRIIEQIKASSASLKDFDAMLKEFYRQRELDTNGMPTRRKLDELGLSSVVADRAYFRPATDN